MEEKRNDNPNHGIEDQGSEGGASLSRHRDTEAGELFESDKLESTAEAQTLDERAGTAERTSSGKAWKISTAVLAVLLAGSIIWQMAADRDKPVALVNGIAIGEQALYEEMVKLGGAAVLDSMIAQESIRQGIEKAGVTAEESEIDAEFAVMIENYGSEAALLATLEQYGYTKESFREQIKTQLQIEKIVAERVAVTDEAIANYFEANKAMLDQPEQVRASHILVETKDEAEQLLAQIESGEDFAVLASAHSLDTSNKDFGGDLNYFGRGWMEEGFETAAFALEVGERGIAETSYGYHVLEVTDRIAAAEATLEGSRDEIRKQLEEEQLVELTNAWIADQQAAAQVENKLLPADLADEAQ